MRSPGQDSIATTSTSVRTTLRRRPSDVAFALVLAALLAPAGASAATAADVEAKALSDRCPYADVLPGQTPVEHLNAGTLCLMNAQRAARGLRVLRAQRTLARVAVDFARQMVDQRFFDHTSPTGATMLTRIKATSYLRHAATWTVAENIAWGTGAMATPRATVQAWMQSPSHRTNLLDRRFADVGIGIAAGAPEAVGEGQAGNTYVADFGLRRRR